MTCRKWLTWALELPRHVGRPVSRAYIPELDGLRCLAILVVLVWHVSLRAARYNDTSNAGRVVGFYADFPHGEVGVLLFFVISGFVVAQPFLIKPKQQWQVRSFYIRRFIRIFPPYLVALSLCYFILGVVGHVPANANSFQQNQISLASSFLASLFYMHSLIFDAPSRLNPPIWSLELEIIFYALVPILMLIYTGMTRRVTRLSCLSLLILGNIVLAALVSSRFDADVRFRFGMLYHGYLFLLGIAAADVAGPLFASPHRKSLLGDGLFVLGLSGLTAVGLVMTAYDARFPGGLLSFGMQVASVAALTLTVVGAFRGRTASLLLSAPWIRLIGTMCYSIYLTHILAVQATSELLGRLVVIRSPVLIWTVWIGLLVPAALAVGTVFYLAVERPFAAAATYRKRQPAQDVPQSA